MKKLILMAAFAGLFGTTVVANTLGDDKDKKAKKECCKKGEGKACAGEKKEACAAGEKKTCCKSKAAAETKGAEEKK
ncbi:MAG: hypothetical protein Q7W45_02400 [Bacteroidota bacterium]|nr:hypothetical protein [Bacteroidota bacterium]MDP3145897.1 hypothetical protein [Bacteroidota bacterium]MDP3558531.1 hypothetical protein [Bacteroidota bacterium]